MMLITESTCMTTLGRTTMMIESPSVVWLDQIYRLGTQLALVDYDSISAS